jgi:hypothetical protein
MKYIVYNNETLKVVNGGILDKEPVCLTNGLTVARYDGIIPVGDILTVSNIQNKKEKYISKEPKTIFVKDEQTGIEYEDYIVEEVEKERTYIVCTLKGTVDETKVTKNTI